MSVEHFLRDLTEGTLVIVPGDRPDILVASLASTVSGELPAVAGIVLTGGYELDPALRRLLEEAPFPVLEAPGETYAGGHRGQRRPAAAGAGRRPQDRGGARRSSSHGVDARELERQIALERPVRMTPTMFEYELVERARSDRRHIVLPEGDDERVLRAAEILLRRGVVDLTLLGDPGTTCAAGPRRSAWT